MYKPETPPGTKELAEVLAYAKRELERVSNEFQQGVQIVQLDELSVAVTKPRTGMTVLADGVNWNPGAGRGVYTYYNGAWHLLG